MEELFSVVVYLFVLLGVISTIRKAAKKGSKETSSMPHDHAKPGKYTTYNKKTHNNKSGSMPHVHENKKYTSMSDASKLPPGYILLNGEPVRVADLEGK